jgi:hypothetical protein
MATNNKKTTTGNGSRELAVVAGDLADVSTMFPVADCLSNILYSKGLYISLKNRPYITVDGWQIAGAFYGLGARVVEVEKMDTGQATFTHFGKTKALSGYRAKAEIFDVRTGTVVNANEAICLNSERGKEDFAEYALHSMAQTRAIGKAYRTRLGGIVKLAGFESTPAEEMDAVIVANSVPNNPTPPPYYPPEPQPGVITPETAHSAVKAYKRRVSATNAENAHNDANKGQLEASVVEDAEVVAEVLETPLKD